MDEGVVEGGGHEDWLGKGGGGAVGFAAVWGEDGAEDVGYAVEGFVPELVCC